jgi:hypothetical protein
LEPKHKDHPDEGDKKPLLPGNGLEKLKEDGLFTGSRPDPARVPVPVGKV